MTDARRPYTACLFEQAKRLDDRRSDAGTIAEALVYLCPVERERYFDVTSRGMSIGARRLYLHDFDQVARSLALQIVLGLRNGMEPVR